MSKRQARSEGRALRSHCALGGTEQNIAIKYKIMKYITAKSASLSCTVQISYQSLEQLIKLKQHLEKYYLNFF